MEMNLREWALPVYTILMQLAIGGFLTLWTIRSLSASKLSKAELDSLTRNPLTIIFITVIVGIIGSHFHLSRPYLSFLAALISIYSLVLLYMGLKRVKTVPDDKMIGYFVVVIVAAIVLYFVIGAIITAVVFSSYMVTPGV